MTDTAEIIIVGGGIHGASLAFHLAERGVKALVVEKNVVGAGATGRSSGLVRMHYDQRQSSELAWASYHYFVNWSERVGGACGFTRTGFIQFVAPEHTEALRANVRMHQEIGIPSLLVGPDDVHRLAPAFSVEDVEEAAYEPESGYADPTTAASSLMSAARRMGAEVRQDCSVTGVLIDGGRVKGIQTSQGAVSAPMVVNAAGAWARQLNNLAGVELPLDTWRHDTMFVVRPKEMGPSHPTVIDEPNEMYFRPEGELTLVGLEDGNPLGQSPDGDADHALPGFVERAVDRICRRIPSMENASLHSAHGGYDGITPDQFPMLGPYGPEGYVLDCGFSGTGFKTAPAVGACMAEWIIEGAPKTVDVSLFSPTRFDEGRHVVGENPYLMIWR